MHPVKRALPAVWLVAATPVGILGYLAIAISDAASDRRGGLIVVVLAGVGILTGGLSLARPGLAVVRASLFASLLWGARPGLRDPSASIPGAIASCSGGCPPPSR